MAVRGENGHEDHSPAAGQGNGRLRNDHDLRQDEEGRVSEADQAGQDVGLDRVGNQGMDRGTGAEAVRAAGDCERLADYLARHPLTMHLQTKYAADFQQVENVCIRPVAGVDPSAWPMVSATGLPQGVPRYLVRAYALLRWSVHESNPDPEALDSALKIIRESDLMLLAEMGMKHALAGQKGRAVQKKAAYKNHDRVVSIFQKLKSARPSASTNDLVSRTANEAVCSEATVWRALRQSKSTVTGPD